MQGAVIVGQPCTKRLDKAGAGLVPRAGHSWLLCCVIGKVGQCPEGDAIPG